MSTCEADWESSSVESSFVNLNVRRPILSVGSLLKHGHGVIFDRSNPYLLLRDESTKSVHRVPMEARGNTFVVHGRMKNVQVRDLVLQQWIADGRLTLQKVVSSANAADLLTKHVSQNVLQCLDPKVGLLQ